MNKEDTLSLYKSIISIQRIKYTNMMDQPCNVCGSTDLNLIDGFYYCVECGTQDVNVRETIVEQTYLADGTQALVGGKKFSIVVKDGMQMSGEWHKWHAYNFILAGLTDELIKLGAKPSVKMKVLWIWVRYIQKYQVKEDLEVKSKIGNNSLSLYSIHQFDTDNSEPEENSEGKQKKSHSEKFTKDIKYVTKGLLLAILYVALNLDKSNIQLSHLFRFIKEGRLSFLNCNKYIPKEIDTKSIPHWKSFSLCQSDYNSFTIRAYAMACIKSLDLGLPFVPDINKIINNYIKELCLPDDFKNLVLSLMLCHPCNHLDIDKVTQKVLVRLPDYEGVAMSYILVALKMCFGLDGEYEERISDVVDKINHEENHMKSHKLGVFSDRTDRLFSFREWIKFLQFRRTILSQHYLPMARQYNQEVDDCVLMEQLEGRPTRPIKLSDEVTMDILNKIPLKDDINVIPKTDFVACLTPMVNYTDIILNYVHDNELRLLLSEDFTQYSLKYATENLSLIQNVTNENLIVGVSESNKMVQPEIEEYFKSKKGDMTMVFVRNCENKNWLKTNPPKAEHVTKVNKNDSSEIDLGYDSHIESSPLENFPQFNDDFKLVCIEGDKDKTNIFDDNFLDLNKDKSIVESIDHSFHNDYNRSNQEFLVCINNADNENEDVGLMALDKQKIIKKLISLACKKYKITLPREYIVRESTRKRKSANVNAEGGESAPKTKRTRPNEAQGKINDMIAAYYNHIDNNQLADALKSLHDPEFDKLDCNSFSFSKIPDLPADDHGDSIVDLNEISPTLNPIVTEELNATDKIVDPIDDEQLNTSKEIDPNFDEKTHSIKQLYVKLKEDVAIGDFSLDKICDDPDVDKIITKKIDQFHNYDNDVCVKNEKEEFNRSDDEESDSEMEYKRQDREKQKENFEPLAKVPEGIRIFKYWLRHYSSRALGKNIEMRQKFDMELNKKLPASFSLIMNECCSILGCSAYVLHKYMQNLEEIIIAKANLANIDDED